jgi:hypothetical protein
MKYPGPLLWLFCACLLLFGEEGESAPQEMPLKMWTLLPFQLRSNSGKPISQGRPDAPNTQFDVRKWFEDFGIEFSPGEQAIYDQRVRTLMVRAKTETLDFVDSVVDSSGCMLGTMGELRVEVDLVEVSASKIPELAGEIPYDAFRKAAGDSWHVLNRTMVVTKDGLRVITMARTGRPEEITSRPPGKDRPQSGADALPAVGAAELLPRGESGAALEIESYAGSNNDIIAVDLHYECRAPGKLGWDWWANNSTLVKDGAPVLLQWDSAPSEGDPAQPLKLRGMVLRVDIIYPGDPGFHRAKEPKIPPPAATPNQ